MYLSVLYWMEKIRVYWYLWLAALLLIPGVLGLLLNADAPFPIAGEVSDWIGFWGSYVGAILSGLISFVILYQTLRSQGEEQRRQRVYERRMDFRRALSDRMSRMDILSLVGAITPSACRPDEMIDRLDRACSMLLRDFNSFNILYSDDVVCRCDSFITAYKQVVDQMVPGLQQLMLLYRRRSDGDPEVTDQSINDFIKELSLTFEPEIKLLWKSSSSLVNLNTSLTAHNPSSTVWE